MISESEELFVTSEELFVSSEDLFVSSEELFVSSGDSFVSSNMAASPLVVSAQKTFLPFKPAMFPREHSRRPSSVPPGDHDSRIDGHDSYLPQTPWRNAWHGKGPGGQIGFGMSQGADGPDGFHTPGYLSWRKLQLSRAKLKASSKTSALLSGFAMVAMVEVQLNTDSKVPDGMLVAFAICTTLLVAVHMLALMISTCILPNIDAVCNLHSIALVHESPHERLHWYIETAWAFSTLLGLLLFLLEIAILCWVKFYDLSPIAAWSACVVLIPVLIVFLAFAVHFYRTLVTHKYEVTVSGIRELEMLKEQMEQGDDRANNGMGLLDRDRIQIV